MLDLTVLYSHPSWIEIFVPGIFRSFPPPYRNPNTKKIEEVRQEQYSYYGKSG